MVKQQWDSYNFLGSLSFILASKLKALKADLRRWNEEVFENVERKKKFLLEELHVLDIVEEERALGVERMKKVEVLSELERSTLMEEVCWR
jgi:septum formation inhibitor MinC